MINVVCGIIFKDGLVLLARRKKGKSLEGFWEFPGGKLKNRESEVVALKRELSEELGLEIYDLERIGVNEHNYETFKIRLIAYRCKTKSFPIKFTDHDKIEWVDKKNLNEYKIADADKPFIKLL
jgi:8-oxo-dGTP diphosphatase